MKATSLLKSIMLLSLLSALAACGRAGPLEPPPASVSEPAAAGDAEDAAADKPFILDGLLN